MWRLLLDLCHPCRTWIADAPIRMCPSARPLSELVQIPRFEDGCCNRQTYQATCYSGLSCMWCRTWQHLRSMRTKIKEISATSFINYLQFLLHNHVWCVTYPCSRPAGLHDSKKHSWPHCSRPIGTCNRIVGCFFCIRRRRPATLGCRQWLEI